MPDTRDSSMSPMSRSPRSSSPSNANVRSEPDAHGRVFSPLRIEQRVDNSTDHAYLQANGDSRRPGTSNSSARLDPEYRNSPGFPFNVPNGAFGEPMPSEPLGPSTKPGTLAPSPSFNQIADPTDFNSRGQLSRKPTNEAGIATPRRSVQFARSTTQDNATAGHSRQESLEEEVEDAEQSHRAKERSRLIAKLKAIANPLQGHSRSFSGFTIGDATIGQITPTGPLSPESERSQPRFITEEGSEADEESAGEGGPSRPARRKRKTKRFDPAGAHTAPTTPRTINGPAFAYDSPGDTPSSPLQYPRPPFVRRGTMSEIPENQRLGMSEDEGRDMLAKESAWRRGLHSRRRLSFSGRRGESTQEGDARRPSNFRRFTAGISARTDGAADSPSTWRQRGERTTSISAQKWRQLKSGLRMLGKQRKEQNRVDHAKSAELVAELLAGAPAALFLASMFQRDEHGHKKIPILMEQLKVSILDSTKIENKGGDRHLLFRIELEYGSGLTRMKWIIHRTLRDFANLHLKYKFQSQREKYISMAEDANRSKLPRFPRSALPYLRGMRGLVDDDIEDEDDDVGADRPHTDGEASGTEGRPGKGKARRRSSFKVGRRNSSVSSPQNTPGIVGEMTARTGSFFGAMPATPGPRKDTYAERQRKKLEQYLQQLITFLMFRADSNRLCKFLELSALGVRLAQEGGYHGKEGFMMIQSSKGIDTRKGWNPQLFAHKHSPKWFLVRHSYIACVDSPEEMNIYDVFLVDPDFRVDDKKNRLRDTNAKELASKAKTSATHPKHHQIRLVNSERRIKLLAKNERQLHQFYESVKFMTAQTQWSNSHRFDSFAPVRHNVWAQWLVDGRDYMWNVSRAISMARDVIYIHDWWLSPELYLRRPPAISQKWRLDRLLQRKAQEGVKVFVIMYRNINSAIPIDSEYTKFSLLDLHPNVFVQRSPNQIKQNQFFWAHHEKICIVDHTVAFCGGVDLCFGRWDTPKHVLNDDKLTGFELDNDQPKDADHCQMWPGKDYSNPRVHDFYDLSKPYEEMYDREKVPRMPWHDIGMQIVGQPARDLTRHFVQRWNYLRRSKKPTRPTPFLLPPPDFIPADLEALGLDGTCEIQMLRSACKWSLGTPERTECSIMNAYVKSIQASDHFVYIENQFYVSTCNVEGTPIKNKINDALFERITRAHKNGEDWRCVLVIPLMPGFQNTVDSQDGTSVRLIMTCQYRSICRGESSLFGRLRAAGIDPEDYIQFFSLRSWGKIGPKKSLITEQLYIHAKCMVVDDRIVIIGSANINERSMLGSRDSEVAAIVRDTEMLPSMMAGKPYKVSRFAHTLRVRLMREHLGIDTDEMLGEEQSEVFDSDLSRPSTAESNSTIEQQLIENKHRAEEELIAQEEQMHSFNHDADWIQENNPNLPLRHGLTTDSRVTDNDAHQRDVRGEGADNMLAHMHRGQSYGRDSTLTTDGREVLVHDTAPEGKGTVDHPRRHGSPKKTRERSNTARSRNSARSFNAPHQPHQPHQPYQPYQPEPSSTALPPTNLPRLNTHQLGLTQLSQLPALPMSDDTDIGGPPLQRTFSARSNNFINQLLSEMRRPVVTPDCMIDPLNDSFYIDTWQAVAENNTKLFRSVFRCMPDNEVRTWKEYREYAAFSERFAKSQGAGKSETRLAQDAEGRTGPPGTGTTIGDKLHPGRLGEKLGGSKDDGKHPQGGVEQWAEEQEKRCNENKKPSTSASANLPVNGHLDEKAALRSNDTLRPRSANDGARERTPSTDNTLHPDRSRTITITEPLTLNTSSTAINRSPSVNAPRSAHSEGNASPFQEAAKSKGSQRRRKRAGTKSSTKNFNAHDETALLSGEDAEQLLEMVQGHLVVWPYDWLEVEERGGGWLYAVDQIAPLEIYS
ncbi:uncharacterized protein K452DRAFT_87979 [Aplosporella prunicola CBS 121167]|uniref:Phospholipase n=1 Tax=Aplosporella prunicola CBS 121167 TaxID=1176127 RepID=A0A6A6B555_9PEZI|nr:uncharacterized protein K452DRAFT_87979 [Aplosporella prunicola CBS 121167]KAF2138543.1 hypothetical protein K452DRAFT_87979 [Aplosporella prunicola CBS 121167]